MCEVNVASEMEPAPLIERPSCHGGCGVYVEADTPLCVGMVCGCVWHVKCAGDLKTCPVHPGSRRGVFPLRTYEESRCILCLKKTVVPFMCHGYSPAVRSTPLPLLHLFTLAQLFVPDGCGYRQDIAGIKRRGGENQRLVQGDDAAGEMAILFPEGER